MDAAAFDALRAAVEADVRAALAAHDASHDWGHVARVRAMALRLARESAGDADAGLLQAVELGALLHDIADWKYGGSDEGNARSAEAALRRHGAGDALVARVLRVVEGVSFSGELGGGVPAELPLDAALVQDADRLEAIGAIGVARCFTYGGAKRRPLHDPAVAPLPPAALSTAAYRDAGRVHTTINHFHEKLLTLRDRMKTPAGRRVAEARHAFTERFLAQFLAEWDGLQ